MQIVYLIKRMQHLRFI